MDAVVVPVLWVTSSVLNASETFVEDVALPKLERMNGVVEAAELSEASRRACGDVVPTPRRFAEVKTSVEDEVIELPLKKFTPLEVWVLALVPPFAIGRTPLR